MDETTTVAATSGTPPSSEVLRARQESNLRVTALETVALPLSYGRLPRERGGCRKGEGRLCAGDRR